MLVLSPTALWAQDTTDTLNILSAYVTNVERQLELGLKEFVSVTEEGLLGAGDPGEVNIKIYDGLDDHNWDISGIFQEYFPQLHRGSVLMTLCAFFEDRLNSLCVLYQNEQGLQHEFKHSRDRGIVRARKYLMGTVGLDLNSPRFQAAWDTTQAIYQVRNNLAHAGSRVQPSHSKLRAAIRKLRHIKPHDRVIYFDSGFLHAALSTFKELTWALHQAPKAPRLSTTMRKLPPA